MKLVGKLAKGATVTQLPADTKRVSRYTFPAVASVAKLSAYLDGQGSGSLDQVVAGVIYDTGGNLIAQGKEVTVPVGTAPTWFDLPLATPVGVLAAAYDLGLIAGPASNSIRTYGDGSAGAGKENTDTYSDGASTTFGAATTLNRDLSIFATYFSTWGVPAEEDEQFARLPFELAQQVLGAGAAVATYSGVVEWHGTKIDQERGSFCIVSSNGPLVGLVGERVRVTSLIHRTRSVVAYVHTESAELTEDLSLTRRLFVELGLLSLDSLNVRVEVLA